METPVRSMVQVHNSSHFVKNKGNNHLTMNDPSTKEFEELTIVKNGIKFGSSSNKLNFDEIFTGKRVLVTGGASGIGLAIVEAFVESKAHVIVFDKDFEALKRLTNKFPTVETVQVDLSNWKETKLATESILPIHHLANNAGIVEWRPFLDIDLPLIDQLFDVNFKAMLNVAQVVAKGIIENDIKDGTIVNTSSACDTTALKRNTVYSSTKAALAMMTKIMALELGQEYGIRVNCVRPGLVNTDMLANLPENMRNEAINGFLSKTTIPKLIEPADVAQAVVFLSSPMSKMVTGSGVTVDGGFGI